MSTGAFPTHWTCFGDGARKALAIHCNLARSGAWAELGKHLQEVLTLHAFDLPGHGESGDWDGKTELHDLCTGIARTFLSEPMDVIGHSFGATVALRLAVENPGKVRTLTLIEPVFFAAALADTPDIVKTHDEDVAPFITGMEEGDLEKAARCFNRVWGDGTPWTKLPKTRKKYILDRMHLLMEATDVLYDDAAKMMVPGALDRVIMPSLLIEGEKSTEVIGAINAALARRLPDARRMIVRDAGHMSPVTHPEEVASAIAALLEVVEE